MTHAEMCRHVLVTGLVTGSDAEPRVLCHRRRSSLSTSVATRRGGHPFANRAIRPWTIPAIREVPNVWIGARDARTENRWCRRPGQLSTRRRVAISSTSSSPIDTSMTRSKASSYDTPVAWALRSRKTTVANQAKRLFPSTKA